MKHIWHCQPKSTGSSLLDQDRIRTLNPLLSLTTNGHSPNINYNCNLYVDQYRDDDYGEDKTSVNNNSNTSGSEGILDNDNINENNLQEPFMSVNATSPQQTNATNRFQVMLHDLAMRHKASLQMFDDIWNLVNDYMSSPGFSVTSSYNLESHSYVPSKKLIAHMD